MQKTLGKSENPLERDIQAQIIKWLRSRPFSFTVKLAAGPYSMPGLPDILYIEAGKAYFFEVKRPDGKMTPLQFSVMDKLIRAGAIAGAVTSKDDVQHILEPPLCPHGKDWDDCPDCCH